MLSVGSILLLTLLTLIIVYLIVGVLYKKAVYAAQGTDLIPNIEFWAQLPGLVRDGYIFFISPCLGNRAEYSTYEQV